MGADPEMLLAKKRLLECCLRDDATGLSGRLARAGNVITIEDMRNLIREFTRRGGHLGQIRTCEKEIYRRGVKNEP